MRVFGKVCFHFLYDFALLRSGTSLLVICFVFSFVCVACAYLIKIVQWMAVSKMMHHYRRSSFTIAARFLWQQLSTALGKTMTYGQRKGMHVDGKLFSKFCLSLSRYGHERCYQLCVYAFVCFVACVYLMETILRCAPLMLCCFVNFRTSNVSLLLLFRFYLHWY